MERRAIEGDRKKEVFLLRWNLTPATNQSTVPFLRAMKLGNVPLNLFYPTSSLQTESLIIRIMLFSNSSRQKG